MTVEGCDVPMQNKFGFIVQLAFLCTTYNSMYNLRFRIRNISHRGLVQFSCMLTFLCAICGLVCDLWFGVQFVVQRVVYNLTLTVQNLQQIIYCYE